MEPGVIQRIPDELNERYMDYDPTELACYERILAALLPPGGETATPDTPAPTLDLDVGDYVDKALAWDAAQASFRKGYEKGKAENASLREQVEKAREALEPFAIAIINQARQP